MSFLSDIVEVGCGMFLVDQLLRSYNESLEARLGDTRELLRSVRQTLRECGQDENAVPAEPRQASLRIR